MNGVAGTIDGFLSNRKSPMAGMGKTFVAAGKKYGVDPRLVVAIAGIESSFGKHIFGSYNAWGWGPGKPFGSWEDGILAVTKGLRSGYLDRGLRTPEQIVHRYAPGSDGNDTENWVRVVNQFLGEMGAKGGKLATTPMSPVPVTSGGGLPSLPPFDPTPIIRSSALANLNEIAQTGKANPSAMLARSGQLGRDLASARAEYDAQVQYASSLVPAGPAVFRDPEGMSAVPKGTYNGKVLQLPATWAGTHITDNLDWNAGRKSAIDIKADPGTPLGAPLSGTIIEHGSAQGGRSLRFLPDRGKPFWLGHIENPLPVGTRVRRGQPIAIVSPNHPRPHAHLDRKL